MVLIIHFLLKSITRDEFHRLVLTLKFDLDVSTKLVLRNTFLLQLLIAVGTLTPWIEADHTPSPEVF